MLNLKKILLTKYPDPEPKPPQLSDATLRYYNREAVVISALQVHKYPVTCPGPFITPPAQRHLFCNNPALQMTPPKRFGSVMSMESGGGALDMSSLRMIGGGGGDPLSHSHHHLLHTYSPKPHSSPKLKLRFFEHFCLFSLSRNYYLICMGFFSFLNIFTYSTVLCHYRYMKSLFPKADETLLLDVLANSENNIQATSEKLESLGYVKKDMIAKQSQVQVEEEEKVEEVIEVVKPKILTEEDKIECEFESF